jgi:hypothetical protein
MKNVAIVAPDFAPSSLPSALRVRFFAQHLPEFGWHPIVIATDPRHYENLVDSENEQLVPASVEVIRTPALSPRFTRKLGFGDLGLRSLWHHWRALSRLCRNRPVDLVFISVPPNPTLILGRIAHALLDLPYVIDYQDPVATSYYWRLRRSKRPPKYALAYAMGRIMEPIALRNVVQIVGVSRGTMEEVIYRYRWLSQEQATEIPLGGELADFEYLSRHPRENTVFNPGDGHRHVSYVGVFTASMEPVVKALFGGLHRARLLDPHLFARIRVHFVGTRYQAGARGEGPIQRLAAECGVADLIEEHPERVPYLDALNLMLQSHALLAVGSVEAHYTASKIFPYILASKPLMAIFHEQSSVVRILAETHAGNMITFRDQSTLDQTEAKIAESLRRLASLPEDYRPSTRWQAFDSYTTRAMAARLAEVFDRAIGTPQPATVETSASVAS